MRLIDADALKTKAIKVSTTALPHVYMKAVGTREIDNAPTIDAEPVRHATWEKGLCSCFVACSKCHDVYINSDWLHDGKWKYCPNCGAKMDGDSHG